MTREEFTQKILDYLRLSDDHIEDNVHQLRVYKADKVYQEEAWLNIIMTEDTQKPHIQSVLKRFIESQKQPYAHLTSIDYNTISMENIHILDEKDEAWLEESILYLLKYENKHYLIFANAIATDSEARSEAIEATSLLILTQALPKIIQDYTPSLHRAINLLSPFVEKEILEQKMQSSIKDRQNIEKNKLKI